MNQAVTIDAESAPDSGLRQLELQEIAEVSGGLWPLIAVLAIVDAGLWGYIAGSWNRCQC